MLRPTRTASENGYLDESSACVRPPSQDVRVSRVPETERAGDYPAGQTEPSRPRPVVVRNTQETGSMGLLDNIFGGGQQTGRGGASPLTLALLALLAYRTYQGKGRLADMMRQSGGADPNPGGSVTGPGRLPAGN